MYGCGFRIKTNVILNNILQISPYFNKAFLFTVEESYIPRDLCGWVSKTGGLITGEQFGLEILQLKTFANKDKLGIDFN